MLACFAGYGAGLPPTIAPIALMARFPQVTLEDLRHRLPSRVVRLMFAYLNAENAGRPDGGPRG